MTRRERLERRLEKRAEWAEKADARSAARFKASHDLVKDIPFGQPILVGHHSEKRHRRVLERSDQNMAKGCEEASLARRHRSKAHGLEGLLDRAVFSDDTDAVEQLEARIAEREGARDRMKEVNRLYRAGDAAGLAALGLNLETLRAKMAGAYSWEKAPYPAYAFSNLGARIRTDKQRLADVKARQGRAARAEAAGGVTVEGGDYVAVTFAEKPPRETLDALKAAGFRWSGGSWCGERAKLPPGVSDAT